jgi:hypothetical protein
MTSYITDDFVKCFRKLPLRIQRTARKNYKIWKKNPHHKSLEFKQVGKRKPIYAVRVGIGWRALGYKRDNSIIWFWIGSHAEYDKLISKL